MSTPDPAPRPHRHARPWTFEPPASGLTDADRRELEELLADLDEMLDEAPMAFLNWVAYAIMGGPISAELFLAGIRLDMPRPVRAAAVAAQWLLGDPAVEIVGLDIPTWLADLDQAELTAVRRRREDTGCTSYLLGLRLHDASPATAQVRVETAIHGAITNAFVTDDGLDALERILRAGRRRKSASYRPVSPRTAAKALVTGLGRHHVSLPAPSPVNPWPDNEPVIAWVLRLLVDAADEPSDLEAAA